MADLDKLCEELRIQCDGKGSTMRVSIDDLLAILDDRDRLIAELDEMRNKCFGCITPAEHGEAIAAAEDDRDRLRKALTDIARQPLSHEPSGDIEDEELDYTDGYDLCIERARAALGEYRHD